MKWIRLKFASKVGQNVEECSIPPGTGTCLTNTHAACSTTYMSHRGDPKWGPYLEMLTNVLFLCCYSDSLTVVCVLNQLWPQDATQNFKLEPIKGTLLSKSCTLWGLYFWSTAPLSGNGCHVNAERTWTRLRPCMSQYSRLLSAISSVCPQECVHSKAGWIIWCPVTLWESCNNFGTSLRAVNTPAVRRSDAC